MNIKKLIMSFFYKEHHFTFGKMKLHLLNPTILF